MTRNTLILTIMLAISSSGLWASWANMPLKKVVNGSPVVVVGTIGKIEVTKKDQSHGKLEIAYITVTRVLKNTLRKDKLPKDKLSKGMKIPLAMPNRGTSKEIIFAKGTTGVWILDFSDGYFWATYPKDYQKPDKEEDIVRIIQAQKAQ